MATGVNKNVIQWGASRLTACGKSAVRRFLENDNGVCTYWFER